MICLSGRFLFRVLGAGVCAVFLAQAVQAAPITVTNPSFEDDGATFAFSGAGPANGLGGAVITGWELTHLRYLANADNLFIGGLNPSSGGLFGDTLPAPADGSMYAWMGTDDTQSPIYFSQAVGLVAADTIYTLNVAVGDRSDIVLPTDWEVSLYSGEPTTGGTPLAQLLSTAGATIPADGTWADNQLVWDSTGSGLVGQELRIVLGSATGGSPGQIGFDNVRLDATLVPEPGSAVLALGSLLCLVGWRASGRRR